MIPVLFIALVLVLIFSPAARALIVPAFGVLLIVVVFTVGYFLQHPYHAPY